MEGSTDDIMPNHPAWSMSVTNSVGLMRGSGSITYRERYRPGAWGGSWECSIRAKKCRIYKHMFHRTVTTRSDYIRAECHPDRKHEGNGLCDKCYQDNQNLARYGITPDDYNTKLREQNGMCAICHSKDPRSGRVNRFFVDHDHRTGEVRGLLCHPCNAGLGSFSDSSGLLRQALEYLIRPIRIAAVAGAPDRIAIQIDITRP